jgi:hypothetical protein
MNYTVCPSQPEQFTDAHFDRYQFDNRSRLLKGTDLDWRDYARMHTLSVGKQQKGRRGAVPAWALRDESTRQVILHYLAGRFGARNSRGNLQQRLEWCSKAGERFAQREKEHTARRIKEYRAISGQQFHELEPEKYERLFYSVLRGETSAEHLKRVELQIQNVDSQAMVSERAPELVLAIAYFAYRLGWNSPSIAEQLGLKPPAVRQILHRLNRSAKRLQGLLPSQRISGRRARRPQ